MFTTGSLVVGVLLFFTMVIIGTYAWGGILAAPWVPVWKTDVERMLDLAGVKPNEQVYDLGAGDGRIIIQAGRRGAYATGFEVALLPYLAAHIRILLAGQRDRVRLRYVNFFKTDFSKADVICAFLTPKAMAHLKPKILAEAKPGCRIISYAFAIPDWKPDVIDKPNEKIAAIYRYIR